MKNKQLNRSQFQKQKRKKEIRRRILQFSLLFLTSVILVVAVYVISLMNKAQIAANQAFEAIDPKRTEEVVNVRPAKDNVSILLLGVDDSETRQQGDDHSRTDAMLVATFNPKMKSIKLLSIPRDSYVYIPEVGYKDKITHAHAFGGVRAVTDSVEQLLDIPIHYYVKMNFNAFIEVVDALGGIEVEVPYERIEKDENDKNAIHLQPGLQHLDGRHALALARTRKLDSDVERGKRQQMIIQAMAERAASASSVLKYGDVIEALGNNMKTNMTFKEMMSFVEYGKNGMPRIDTVNLDGADDWSTGVYYYKIDDDSLRDVQFILKNHLNRTKTSSRVSSSENASTIVQSDSSTK